MASRNSLPEHRRIRAPKRHGQTLHIPSVFNWPATWQENLRRDNSNASFSSFDLNQLKTLARNEILDLARAFTSQYREVASKIDATAPVVMGGHQPELFHPGVWYKNFVLDRFAKQFDATAINLIIDSDLCRQPVVHTVAKFPLSERRYLKPIYFDASQPFCPFESRPIADFGQFAQFQSTVRAALAGKVENPIIDLMWPYVIDNSRQGNLGLAIANGRHRLEQDLNLQTLEIPISLVSGTLAFSIFVREILLRIDALKRIYNSSLGNYRRANKIKNLNQPLPDLIERNGWTETPFWVWRRGEKKRDVLFVCLNGKQLCLADSKGTLATLDESASNDAFHAAINADFVVRPKALMTTLFHRLVACDLFIHGIGGSIYDQVTDEIASRFFQVRLPLHLTVTATFHINPNQPQPSKQSLSTTSHLIRQMYYQPEKFIDNPDASTDAWIQCKRDWIQRQLPPGQRLNRHRKITECNAALRSRIEHQRLALEEQLAKDKQLLSQAKITHSREFSYVLHDAEILQSLNRL